MSLPSLLVSNRSCRSLISNSAAQILPQASQILRARSSLTHSLMGKNAPLRVNQPSKAVSANTAECSAHLHANALAYSRKKATYLKVSLTHTIVVHHNVFWLSTGQMCQACFMFFEHTHHELRRCLHSQHWSDLEIQVPTQPPCPLR